MRPLFLLAALVVACQPLTEAERDAKAYEWQEHVAAWKIYEAACQQQGGYIYWKAHRACVRRECIPKQYEWRYWYNEDGELRWQSANIQCAR